MEIRTPFPKGSPTLLHPFEENKRNGNSGKVLCRDFPIELQLMYQRFRRRDTV